MNVLQFRALALLIILFAVPSSFVSTNFNLLTLSVDECRNPLVTNGGCHPLSTCTPTGLWQIIFSIFSLFVLVLFAAGRFCLQSLSSAELVFCLSSTVELQHYYSSTFSVSRSLR